MDIELYRKLHREREIQILSANKQNYRIYFNDHNVIPQEIPITREVALAILNPLFNNQILLD